MYALLYIFGCIFLFFNSPKLIIFVISYSASETDVMAAFGRHDPQKISGLRPPVPCARRPLAAAVSPPPPGVL